MLIFIYNYRGEQGAPGSQGETGAPGAVGERGGQGPQGLQVGFCN